MKLLNLSLLGFLFLSALPTFAGEDGMVQMPKIKPVKVFTIESKRAGEDLLDKRGFGDSESSVRMMNLMMVEGSGYEGMEMSDNSNMGEMHMGAKHQEKSTESSPSKYEIQGKLTTDNAKVGSNSLVISVTDLKTKKPVQGLKLKAQVYMTSMDMGTEEPRVRETSPGKYEVKVAFSMRGPWAVKVILPSEEKIFNFEAISSKN